MVTEICVNIGPINGLLPDSTNTFTWTNVDFSLVRFHLSQEGLMNLVCSMCSEKLQF